MTQHFHWRPNSPTGSRVENQTCDSFSEHQWVRDMNLIYLVQYKMWKSWSRQVFLPVLTMKFWGPCDNWGAAFCKTQSLCHQTGIRGMTLKCEFRHPLLSPVVRCNKRICPAYYQLGEVLWLSEAQFVYLKLHKGSQTPNVYIVLLS